MNWDEVQRGIEDGIGRLFDNARNKVAQYADEDDPSRGVHIIDADTGAVLMWMPTEVWVELRDEAKAKGGE